MKRTQTPLPQRFASGVNAGHATRCRPRPRLCPALERRPTHHRTRPTQGDALEPNRRKPPAPPPPRRRSRRLQPALHPRERGSSPVEPGSQTAPTLTKRTAHRTGLKNGGFPAPKERLTEPPEERRPASEPTSAHDRLRNRRPNHAAPPEGRSRPVGPGRSGVLTAAPNERQILGAKRTAHTPTKRTSDPRSQKNGQNTMNPPAAASPHPAAAVPTTRVRRERRIRDPLLHQAAPAG